MKLFALSLIGLLPLIAVAGGGDDATEKDLKALEGTWAITHYEVEGEVEDPGQFKGVLLVIKDKTYVFTRDGQPTTAKGTLDITPTKKPKGVDYTYTDGPDKGKSCLGIYEIKGDTFKDCFAPNPGDTRPTTFETKPGSGLKLVVYERVKE